MKFKKYLEELIARKQSFIKEARDKVKKSDDINEVRALGDQIEEAQKEIEEARSQLAEVVAKLEEAKGNGGEEGGEDMTGEEGGEEQPGEGGEDQARARSFKPGNIVRSFDMRDNQARANMEKRAKAFASTGRQSVTTEETRATLISGGKIATPTEVSGINDAFTQVSSIVDLVKVVDCEGMGAYKVAYEITSATAATQTEGAAANDSDPTFGYVEITPQTEAVVSTISKQVRKQSPLNYTEKVRSSALTALRKRAAKIITDKINASTLNSTVEVSAIDDKTLRNIALNYGGNESIEGSAVLFLNKADLIAFGDVRGSDKKPVYEITPDAGNPNTGIIKDGGLSVKYCLNSNCTALSASGTLAETKTMIYGDPHCFELGLFSNYEIAVSEDRNIEKLMLTIVGDVELGGDVTVDKGFVVVKKSA